MNSDVSLLIERLRDTDSQVFDNAFGELCDNIQEAKSTIYNAALQEQGPHAKGALIELLGESGDASYVPYIGQQLKSDEPEIVFWSYIALKSIGTEQALELADKREIQETLLEFREKERNAAANQED